MTNTRDTIAAISTPPGRGGIALVRMSGPGSVSAADKLFKAADGTRPSEWPSHVVRFGSIIMPGSSKVMDEALLTVMLSPKSYTREDVVEISCHGGDTAARGVLLACFAAGARPAEPGEFTKRAFLNGRIDLSQAEAVLDIISSSSTASMKAALEQLKGHFSEEISGLRKKVLDVLSLVELTIDFSQEDVHFPGREEVEDRLTAINEEFERLRATCPKGILLREGASVVIAGRPNVGKSSLMNALLRHDRVIVAPVAGTTRDVIEESIEISGIRIRLSDTAGIIDTTDRVEMEGIRRSRQKLVSAQAVIFIVDASVPIGPRDEEIYGFLKDKPHIIAANKSDVAPAWGLKEASVRFPSSGAIVSVSALKRTGLDALEDALAGILGAPEITAIEGPIITNERHALIIEQASSALSRAVFLAQRGYNAELIASDLNEVIGLLGMITGEAAGDDVLERIFSKFCVGK